MEAETIPLKKSRSFKTLDSGSRHKVKVARSNLNQFGLCLDFTCLLDLLFSVDQRTIRILTASRTRKFQNIFAGHFRMSVRQPARY